MRMFVCVLVHKKALTIECVPSGSDGLKKMMGLAVFSYYRMCSLTIECVL